MTRSGAAVEAARSASAPWRPRGPRSPAPPGRSARRAGSPARRPRPGSIGFVGHGHHLLIGRDTEKTAPGGSPGGALRPRCARRGPARRPGTAPAPGRCRGWRCPGGASPGRTAQRCVSSSPGADAGAEVAHVEQDAGVPPAVSDGESAQADGAAGRRVLDGVLQQVGQHQGDLDVVGPHQRQVGGGELDPRRLGVGQPVQRRADDFGQVAPVFVGLPRAGFQAGQVQQVADQAASAGPPRG